MQKWAVKNVCRGGWKGRTNKHITDNKTEEEEGREI